MRLLLFDIDGTLVHANQTGRAVIVAALEQTFGTAGAIAGYSMAGRVDRQIILELMTGAGWSVAAVEARLPHVFDQMEAHGRRLFRAANGVRPCPGVPALLAALRQREGVTLGLLTGNIPSTAPLKLAAAGIDPAQFQFGAYGSDAGDRHALPAIALERAWQRTGHRFSGADAMIVGDTPADISCARYADLPVLAVATGSSTMEQLTAAGATAVLPDLGDTDAALRILLGPLGGRT